MQFKKGMGLSLSDFCIWVTYEDLDALELWCWWLFFLLLSARPRSLALLHLSSVRKALLTHHTSRKYGGWIRGGGSHSMCYSTKTKALWWMVSGSSCHYLELHQILRWTSPAPKSRQPPRTEMGGYAQPYCGTAAKTVVKATMDSLTCCCFLLRPKCVGWVCL